MIIFRISAVLACAFLALCAPPVAAETPSVQAPTIQVPTAADSSNPPANAAPSANPPVSAAPAATTEKSSALGVPVESGTLQNIDPDSIGLLTAEGGGLGATMWKDTPRELVDRFLPVLVLPTASPTLNGLAQRFLLTAANVPEGAGDKNSSLTIMRIRKLLMLGDAVDAWNLALLARAGQIDDATLRLAAEAALISSVGQEVCEKLPSIIQNHDNPEWQKSLVTCQLRANDAKAAQLGLEILHTQNIKDDTFFELAEHNIIGSAKSLPRHLTPLKPLDLALLRTINQPLPPELYPHPDAVLIPELLKANTHDDKARLALAERAAARSTISSKDLGAVYRSISFPSDDIANPPPSQEQGPRLRALLYQAASQEKMPPKRFGEVEKFMAGLDGSSFNGAAGQIMAEMIGNVPPSGDYAAYAVTALHVYILAGRPNEALGWLKAARQASTVLPALTDQVRVLWPLVVLSGIESDSDYTQNFGPWLDAMLKDANPARRGQTAELLAVFEAAGFAVPKEAWMRITDPPADEKRALPPPLLLIEALHSAGTNNQRGPAVLFILAMADGDGDGFSLLPSLEIIRGLRAVGLTADALAFARETAGALLAPPASSRPR